MSTIHEQALKDILKRATPTKFDTDEDLRRDLYHIKHTAERALKAEQKKAFRVQE